MVYLIDPLATELMDFERIRLTRSQCDGIKLKHMVISRLPTGVGDYHDKSIGLQKIKKIKKNKK